MPEKSGIAAGAVGRAGGYRTIHYFGGEDVPVFLLALIDKGQKANLTQSERNELARILPEIAESYRVMKAGPLK